MSENIPPGGLGGRPKKLDWNVKEPNIRKVHGQIFQLESQQKQTWLTTIPLYLAGVSGEDKESFHEFIQVTRNLHFYSWALQQYFAMSSISD